ncbi:MAG TPA: hypothetical protein H9778_04680 [Candidatus Parabacteroides intestinavium]|nr:hypothetical protein [Candidatus Parabacteroides intestinavium]
MESIKKEKKRENMWHWNQPENGLSIEDCERIAEESRLSAEHYIPKPRFAVLFR